MPQRDKEGRLAFIYLRPAAIWRDLQQRVTPALRESGVARRDLLRYYGLMAVQSRLLPLSDAEIGELVNILRNDRGSLPLTGTELYSKVGLLSETDRATLVPETRADPEDLPAAVANQIGLLLRFRWRNATGEEERRRLAALESRVYNLAPGEAAALADLIEMRWAAEARGEVSPP